jgi:hypothetical protein
MESTVVNSDPKPNPKKRTKKKIEEISGSVSKPTRKITKTKIKNKGEASAEASAESEKAEAEKDEDKAAVSDDKIYVPMLEPEKGKSNEALQKMEIEEHSDLKTPDKNLHIDALYPTMNDPFFSDKISRRREYTYMTYDGDIRDIEDFSNYLCKNPIFELMPHQLFVRNFISRNTPYNSILLYHGLGSGKTCSAIGIAEELREYAKQTGSSQRIMVIASTNVQDNFRLQLFDERNLKEENGNWTIKSCIGNKLLKEINPTGEKGLKAEDIISQANSIINANYAFMGYLQLANYIIEHVTIPTTASYTAAQKRELEIQNIKKFFNNRLIIIDEVHNIHLNNSKNNENKIAKLLLKVAKYADNMKLVLLSATPVYNSVKEIIWLTNLMNVNDNRAEIDVGDVFAADGSFVKARKGRESGDELLRRKLTGYVSYVRGENPYTFPFRVYPEFFAREKTFLEMEYPSKTLSNKPVREPLKHLDGRLYVNQIGSEQERGYKFIVENMVRLLKRKGDGLYFLDESANMKEPDFENMESYGYSELQAPLQALIMMYPSPLLRRNVDEDVDPVSKEMFKEISKQIIGKDGLRSTMDFVEEQTEIELNAAASEERQTLTVFKKYNFEYKKGVERIFHQEHLHKYSSKIASICDCIRKSRGIVLIYTQYIDGGIVPMALALEEMGFTRTGTPQHGQAVQPLFKKLTTRNVGPRTQVEPLNAVDLRPQSQVGKSDFSPAKYMILTGDKYFSYNNAEDVKIATSKENVEGRNVRVILISKAASEGLDFKSIRQVHILDPWYNLNRLEQIIGRGVRNMSHCGLDFKERNVEVYLHATTLTNKTVECADLYVYRYAEKKAVDIGAVNRIMKTVSVDCVLNIAQTNFTCSILNGKDENCDKSVGRKLSDKQLSAIAANQEIKIRSSTNPDPEGKPFLIGDRPFTEACDYMECNYKCPAPINKGPIIEATYHKDIITANNTIIIQKIKDLYATEGYPLAFNRSVITKLITASKNKFEIDPKINSKEIDFALTAIIENPTEILVDNLGRTGRLINRGNYYIFQPVEIRDNQSSILDSSLPVQNKASHVNFEIENAVLPEVEVEPVITSSAAESSAYTKILEEFKTNLDYVKNAEPNIIPPKNLDWYIHLNSLGKPQTKTKENPNPPPPTRSKEYIKNTFGITDAEIEKYAVFHMIDTVSHSKKQTLAKYVAENAIAVAEGLDSYISQYFEPLIFKSEGVIKILLAKQNKNTMLTKEEGEEWMEENPEDDSQFRAEVLKRLRRTNFSNFFGFIGDFEKKTIHNMVFKIKRLSQARNNTGAYLQNYIKKTVIEKLNYVLGTVAKTVHANPSKYAGTTAGKIYEIAAEIKINEKEGTVENPKYTDDNTDISQVAVAGLIEVVMRKLNDEDIDGKTWFLNAEEGITNKAEVL